MGIELFRVTEKLIPSSDVDVWGEKYRSSKLELSQVLAAVSENSR
jgi:hypothetical protein